MISSEIRKCIHHWVQYIGHRDSRPVTCHSVLASNILDSRYPWKRMWVSKNKFTYVLYNSCFVRFCESMVLGDSGGCYNACDHSVVGSPDMAQGWYFVYPLQWRHNDHDCVWSHQPHGCLLTRLFRRRSKKTSKLRVTGLCAGNSPGPVNSPHKGPVTRKMFPFDDVIMLIYFIDKVIVSEVWHKTATWQCFYVGLITWPDTEAERNGRHIAAKTSLYLVLRKKSILNEIAL